GYEISLTREQLLTPQYSYPRVNESDEGAELVFPLIAYRWREGTDDLRALRDAKPSLIIGQRNPFEHTNPAFVIGVTEILVSDAACEAWPAATTFPLPGLIAAGETVKLQHPDFGLVKMHYTLDGSAPTVLSPMYNPSTYQPELNAPIPILEPTVIRVLVTGYGKEDSEIATFYFTTN
ncbi:MAG: chitobiase/beta-hexosaminidase C-terminal domain-containing protein, partial [Clostridiales bacterium]|nr:chitobiase/beta-hexosaminidase C-terminal domain-containing protein [Clostridiales bacterium]